MHILAIVGSLRSGSYNRQLAEAADALMKQRHPDVAFSYLDWSDIPFMNEDSEHPAPKSVSRVRSTVKRADGLWLFSPEYNHGIPGPLKNLIDWLSRPVSGTESQVLEGKPIALSGASIGMSGASHAQEQLINVLSFLDTHIMNKPRLSIPSIGSQTVDGILELSSSFPHLEKQADAFVRFIEHDSRLAGRRIADGCRSEME